jgi:hypothetical protein
MVKYLFIFLAIVLCGCASNHFYESVIGSATTVGIVLPTENLINFEVLNTLDGCKIKIKEPCYMVHHFTMTNNTTWFNLFDSSSKVDSTLTLNPTTNIIHQTYQK